MAKRKGFGKGGKRTYVPNILVEAVDKIREEEDIGTQSEAIRKIVKFSEIGKEAKLKFPDIFGKRKKRK